MNHWWRFSRLLWPYRQQVVLSLMFGTLSASLWGLELLLTFPVATVFVEGKTLGTYVQEQVVDAQDKLQNGPRKLDQIDRSLMLLTGRQDEQAVEQRLKLLRDQSHLQLRLNSASRRLWWLNYFQAHCLVWFPEQPFQLLLALFALLIATTFVKGACSFAQDVWASGVAELCVIDLRSAMFRRLLHRDPQAIELDGAPQLLSSLTFDLQGLTQRLTLLGGRVVREPLKAVACLVAAFWLNWQLTALLLLFVPLGGWMFHRFGQRLRNAVHRLMDTMARIYRSLEETFTNVRAVMAFGMQGSRRREFHRQNREFSRHWLKIVTIDALTNPATEVLGMIAVMAVVLPGAYLVLRETTSIWGVRLTSAPMTVADLSTLYALLAGVVDPLRKFSKYFTTIKQCGSALERSYRVMDRAALVQQSATPQWLPPLQNALELRDVHFRYAAAEVGGLNRTSVLNGVSLTISAGETIAVVGPNGSGKSTLLGLLLRFYDAAEGSVLFDGIDIRDVRLAELRRQIAWVPQDAVLLDDTIAENIRYGCPDATPAEVRDAARRAYVLEFADGLPLGLDTRVGERGRELSGGQRQRIALARAILRDPQILLLDEPTAAIDAQSEQWIHESLREFARGRTTLLITHLLGPALLSIVDRVVVLDRGRVAAFGRHDELQQMCPLYQQLFAQPGRAAA